jgi:glycosyltransferase involved in cell wall biosynthesis
MARELHLGGSERQLAEVAMSLDRKLFEPTVACFNGRGVRADDLRRAGVLIVEFPVRSFGRPETASLAWRFLRWLRRHHTAVIHAFDVPTALFGVPLARLARVPVVLSSQRGDRGLFPVSYQRALRITDRLVDGVVVNSDYIRSLLALRHGVPDALMHTCRNGLDTSVFHADGRVRRSDVVADGCVVGTVAALRAEKSIETLMAAFALLTDTRHRLLIIGEGPCQGALEAQARELNVAGRCRFIPATAHVAPWYRSIDIFVLPSINESFSNSLMEAMACGCCVVASSVGGNPELVRDGENGLLFEAGNAADLARKLEIVLTNIDRRRVLARAAVRTIQTDYTNERSARRFAVLYQRQLGGRTLPDIPVES